MAVHPLAGQQTPRSMLVNVPRLVTAYYEEKPEVDIPSQRVSFGTSGHRGSSLERSFNEDHILAITQAICDCRREAGTTGPLFLGMDTHALSEPSHATALEVLAANGVDVMIDHELGYTPTPVISHAILTYNRGRTAGRADGIVITPSHNPPQDGGLKYNPPEGGPADVQLTALIESRANSLIRGGLSSVRRLLYERALRAPTTHRHDYVQPYIRDLANVVELAAVRNAAIRIGVDPLGGASLPFWEPLAACYGLRLELVNDVLDPTFAFMTVDWDGQIRMDCSSPWAMARLVALKDRFDIAAAADPDGDRHGIVTGTDGLMNPNHYLAVAVWYLFQSRPGWRTDAAVGKTLVSSGLIDRVTASLGRRLYEVPVGFKWFVPGLLGGSLGFGSEESAGASFLRKDGSVWTTDKDGIVMDLLAAEITAVTGRDPSAHFAALAARFGRPWYERIDVPATASEKAILKQLMPATIKAQELAGDPIVTVMNTAPGNGAPISGIKIATAQGWFAARPSGTEDVYKIYTESFRSREHLEQIQAEAREILASIFRAHGAG